MAAKQDAFWTKARVERAKKILARHSSLSDAATAVSKALKSRVSSAALDNAFYQRGVSARAFLQKTIDGNAYWTRERAVEAQGIAAQHFTIDAALLALAQHFNRPVPRPTMDSVFRKYGLPSVHKSLRQVTPALGPAAVHTGAPADALPRLVELVRKPIEFPELCDKLDMSPGKVKILIERARAAGVLVHVEHNTVAIHMPKDDRILDTKISPIVGKRQHIAHISDLHRGSKYAMRDQLTDFCHRAYERGIRTITCGGDNLDGQYHHGKFEVTHVGIEAQTRELHATLPALPGLRYHCITGNHDWTFTEASGVDTGHYVKSYFRDRGREDIEFYGDRGAYLRLHGIVMHLWHPGGGSSYAISYKLQKKVEAYSSIKPQILIAGHWHRMCYVYERGVHAMAAPCFQGGGSAFGKSLPSGAPAIGGLFLSWDLTKDGTIREFAFEKRSYYEREKPVEIYNNLDAHEVDEMLYEAEAKRAQPRKRT